MHLLSARARGKVREGEKSGRGESKARSDCRTTLLVLLNLCIVQVIANLLPEKFHEELVLRPERDGRLVSRFAFTTMIEGAYPRDPQTLGLEDHGSYP